MNTDILNPKGQKSQFYYCGSCDIGEVLYTCVFISLLFTFVKGLEKQLFPHAHTIFFIKIVSC